MNIQTKKAIAHKSKKDGSVPAEFKILRTGVNASNVPVTSVIMPRPV